MKKLSHLNNVEKAKLFFDLFPDEITIAINVINSMCEAIVEQQEELRKDWPKFHLISANCWIQIATEIIPLCKVYSSPKTRFTNQRLASDIFDGLYALVAVQALQQSKQFSEKAQLAIKLLF
jgi:hypothetical protein